MTLAIQRFHQGELFVQRVAGVAEEASRLAGMLAAPNLDGGMSRFAAARDLAMITCRDDGGNLWISPLYGRPGFCHAHGATLVVSTRPISGDPLERLRCGEQAGLLLMDFGKRRRLRVNGNLVRVEADEIEISADQAFGNCPQYIQRRHLRHQIGSGPETSAAVRNSESLEPSHILQITSADTFILGTTHPTRGADASHRGGPPGFVRVENGELWWPDYPGNNLFNSMGNIVENPATALLFMDFEAGTTVQLSGRATLEWTVRGARGDDGGTGRRVRFAPGRIASTTGLPYRLLDMEPYAKNPPITR
jgi:predicted pyridoxine 5'-phosphate oxidase superfamily flavin-nucleotide-binding protein